MSSMKEQLLQHFQADTESAIMPELFHCAELAEVLQWAGAVAPAEFNIHTMLSFGNMKREPWHYQSDILSFFFPKELNCSVKTFLLQFPLPEIPVLSCATLMV